MPLPYPDPPLTDEGIVLRPWDREDLALVEEASRDPYIPVITTLPAPYSKQAGRVWIDRQQARTTAEEGWSLAIADAVSGDALGSIVVMLGRPGVGELGYWIVRHARGGRRAECAVRLISRWALTTAGLARVQAFIEPWNRASERAVEHAGFTREGLLRSYLDLSGRRADAIAYSLLPTDLGGDQPDATGPPPEVAALLGGSPRRLLGYGAARVLGGCGMVAKVGPAAIVAREARILSAEAGRLALEVPELIAAGPGWLVMREVSDDGGAWDEPGFAALLGDLARLHDTFESSAALAGGWLRDPAGADLAATIAEGGDQVGIELPDALRRVRADPGPVAQVIADAGPLTLVHGDPIPANVRRTGGRRVWIDWEWASAAPAAVDLACWLAEGPWQFARCLDRDAALSTYLAARSRPVDRPTFERALDAALVLFLFANNLPSLARKSGRAALEAMIAERLEALKRVGLG